jgi:hypothetical protein
MQNNLALIPPDAFCNAILVNAMTQISSPKQKNRHLCQVFAPNITLWTAQTVDNVDKSVNN